MPAATDPAVKNRPRTQEFEALYREHAPAVYRTARTLTGSRDDAEDVMQSVFLGLLRSGDLKVFRNPGAYLYRAAVNASLNVLRARRRHVLTDDLESLEYVAAPARDHSAHRLVDEILAQLSPEAAQILMLRYVDGYSDREIADRLAISRGAVAVRVFRLRIRLRKLLSRAWERDHEL